MTALSITSWNQLYSHSASTRAPLLAQLERFPDSLLVAGCDRPATTAVARLLKRSGAFADHAFGHDDELDGALLLAGHAPRRVHGRHCFQTAHLNAAPEEYFVRGDFRLVWLLRNPHAALRAQLDGWKRGVRARLLPGERRLDSRSTVGMSRLDKACLAYAATVRQTFTLCARLSDRIAVVDYDELGAHRERLLPQLFSFAEAPFDSRLLSHLPRHNTRKLRPLADWETARITELALPAYELARALATLRPLHG